MLVSKLFIVLALFSCLSVFNCQETYDGYKVLELFPKVQDHINYIYKALELTQVEGYTKPTLFKPFTMLVGPRDLQTIIRSLRSHHLPFTTFMDDVQKVIDEQHQQMFSTPGDEFDFDIFNSLEAIQAQVKLWYDTCPDDLECDLRTIGTTYHNNDIQLLKFGSVAGSNNVIFFNALIHAREWITGATIMKLLDHMMTQYGIDDDVTRLIDTYDFYVIPVYNPDGYNHSTYDYRLHRKNLSPNRDSDCLGTDLNRNNDFRWGNDGTSDNPCDSTFCGDYGGSELETQAYNKALLRIQNESPQTIWSMSDYHSFGLMWLHPYGNTINFEGEVCERSDDHDDMYHVSEVTVRAIEATHGTTWTYGTSCEVIYATTGGTDDWAKAVAGVKYSFNPEIRGTFFVIEPEEIQPSFEEIWNGFVAMCDEIALIHEL